MLNNFRERLKGGETLSVRTLPLPAVAHVPRHFRIRGTLRYGVLWIYIILPDGKYGQGYKGAVMSPEDMEDWQLLLEECPLDPNALPERTRSGRRRSVPS